MNCDERDDRDRNVTDDELENVMTGKSEKWGKWWERYVVCTQKLCIWKSEMC